MIKELFRKPVIIFGVGNILWGDDGFGPAVVEALNQRYQLPPEALALDVGTSIRDILFDLVLSDKKPEKIFIIDGVEYPDRQPGEVFEIPVAGIPTIKTSDFSLHQFPTVNMLQELQEHSPIDITVLVVQIETIPQEVHIGLSAPVARAVDTVCQRILADLQPATPA
jgi:coenzyme F420 hydrogenase subunit delta